ncbi:MAG: hypothetical protein KDA63_03190 [Planctomycetales bacterium]|nr:hypothetical protein [Planctomycetales bacterium]
MGASEAETTGSLGTNVEPSKPRHNDRLRKVSLRLALFSGIVITAFVATLHFTGIVAVHRWPRILGSAVKSPEVPEIAEPRTHVRNRFAFSYPSNWSIDTVNEYHDPDHQLYIDSAGRGQVMIQVRDIGMSCRDAVAEMERRFDLPGVTFASRDEFLQWGAFNGYGVVLTGTKLTEPFQVRVFAYGVNQASLIVVEYRFDGPNGYNVPGYRLIEESFVLNY